MLTINIKIINVEWGWFERLMWRKTALPKGHEGDFARRSIEFWNRTLRNILYIWVVLTKGLLYYENRIALRLFSSIFDLCLSITNHNWKEIKSDCMGVVVSKNAVKPVTAAMPTNYEISGAVNYNTCEATYNSAAFDAPVIDNIGRQSVILS